MHRLSSVRCINQTFSRKILALRQDVEAMILWTEAPVRNQEHPDSRPTEGGSWDNLKPWLSHQAEHIQGGKQPLAHRCPAGGSRRQQLPLPDQYWLIKLLVHGMQDITGSRTAGRRHNHAPPTPCTILSPFPDKQRECGCECVP